jgi:tRNA (guanine37-N1)-methyltransferase
MKFTVVTLFPQLIEGFLAAGLLRQAVDRGELTIDTLNPRAFTHDVHQTVDDRVFGGGDGMVMKVEPLLAAVDSLRVQEPCRVVVLSPQGRRWNQALAREYAAVSERVVLVCGRYAGIDNRFTVQADDEISLGDFILNGGEVAACAIIESVARLQPGVLGNDLSATRDSFSEPLLECPQFTRPREIGGLKVPAVLLGGHHEKIHRFERAVAVVRTALRRPDLLPAGTSKDLDVRREANELEVLEDAELKALGITREQLARLKAHGK